MGLEGFERVGAGEAEDVVTDQGEELGLGGFLAAKAVWFGSHIELLPDYL